ncbi:hypothetical protein BGZ95_004588, partial [Linnemannia exigua]
NTERSIANHYLQNPVSLLGPSFLKCLTPGSSLSQQNISVPHTTSIIATSSKEED